MTSIPPKTTTRRRRSERGIMQRPLVVFSFVQGVLFFLLLLTTVNVVNGVRNLQILSPLQVFTIWDKNDGDGGEPSSSSPRSSFLDRYRVGLEAETIARQRLSSSSIASDDSPNDRIDTSSKDWAKQAEMIDNRRRQTREELVEAAYDNAVRRFDEEQQKQLEVSKKKMKMNKKTDDDTYQFVGVINPQGKSSSPITWYARKKPLNSNWSVRLVHVNRNAVLQDLFKRGKIDIFAKYENTGKPQQQVQTDGGTNNKPVVTRKYAIRERSYKNLWNFSLKHFFTDSSGMYWRERRIRDGLYTDGNIVYEATYRYRDGRNGMHRLSTLQQYIASIRKNDGIDAATKKQRSILNQLHAKNKKKKNLPDVVLEE